MKDGCKGWTFKTQCYRRRRGSRKVQEEAEEEEEAEAEEEEEEEEDEGPEHAAERH